MLKGRDIIVQSQTGSGKTLAFAVPILQKLKLTKSSPQALVICPTRELCTQVAKEIRTLGRQLHGLVVTEICGGQPIRQQLETLRRGVHIIVATPGRLLDHLSRDSFDRHGINVVVLDEADRMLDMGFGGDVAEILQATPASRQTALFSATFPHGIKEISKQHQSAPLRITIEDKLQNTLRHQVTFCPAEEKSDVLLLLLQQYNVDRTLVFCNFKKSVNGVVQSLRRLGCSVDRLDGDLQQYQRDQVLAKFKNKSTRVLVATDVAGRGIDVDDIDLVINYELPDKLHAYQHRVGRSARAGKDGLAISIALPKQQKKVRAISEALDAQIEQVTPPPSLHLDIVSQDAKMRTIQISCGRKDKIRPGDILGALTGDAGGLKGSDIGKIDVRDKITYVAVENASATSAAKAINHGRIKKKKFRATIV